MMSRRVVFGDLEIYVVRRMLFFEAEIHRDLATLPVFHFTRKVR